MQNLLSRRGSKSLARRIWFVVKRVDASALSLEEVGIGQGEELVARIPYDGEWGQKPWGANGELGRVGGCRVAGIARASA